MNNEPVIGCNRKAPNAVLTAIVLVALIASLYAQFLGSQIVFDDIPFFMSNESGEQPVSAYRFSLFEIRSLPYATLTWTQAWFGLDLPSFRIGNLLLHAAVTASLYLFLQSLLLALADTSGGKLLKTPAPYSLAAFFAALLFGLHPVATYAAGYLVQRSIVMATLFSLLAMLSYLRGSASNKPFWLWMSVPLYYLAVFSKEHAVMLPAVLVALTVLLHDDWRKTLLKRWHIFAVLAAIALLVVLAKIGILGSIYEPVASAMLLDRGKWAYPLSILTQSWLFFKYAWLWVLPNSQWMSADMREPFAEAVYSRYLLPMVIFLAWGMIATWLLFKRGIQGLAGFALLFPWLMFFTEFSTVRIQEVFVLYRSYLWAVGAFCLFPILFATVTSRVAVFLSTLAAIAMFLISMERLLVLSTPLFLWDDAEKLVKDRPDVPGAYRIYYNRGTELLGIGSLESAASDFKKSIQLNRNFAESYGNLGSAYAQKSDWKNAALMFENAIHVAKNNGTTLLSAQGNLGYALQKQNDWHGAVSAYGAAIDLAKRYQPSLVARYYLGRAQAYEKLGEFQKAQADYQEACTRAKKGCDKLTVANGSAAK